MHKKLIAMFVLLSIIIFQTIYSANAASSNPEMLAYSKQVEKFVKKIQRVPEAKQLIKNIQKDGAFYITSTNSSLARQFGAFWDGDRRIICVDISGKRTEGEIIGSIIFEMHNALASPKLNRLDYLASTGQIDKESYVRGVERLEYENSLNAAEIAEKGIRLGLFPYDACLYTYSSFEEHYYYQKIGKHSDHIARNYDQLAPKYYGRYR